MADIRDAKDLSGGYSLATTPTTTIEELCSHGGKGDIQDAKDPSRGLSTNGEEQLPPCFEEYWRGEVLVEDLDLFCWLKSSKLI